ncbi:MAG: low molecular weight phosphotyrosine protein phosphatase [Halobacteriovoraceae bacterium]|nr:low molecular weight phosphotyrosine protein phosphatase [Halobacteriovoraceae bacterium]MCB9094065.1 low molecular weight phosphotyrosine protein phosphatase [Halobacteriovoraceae bacterium]
MKVLFVCLGNICRSPAAEGIFQKILKDNNFHEKIYCDSAGTGGWHAGEKADPRMREHAEKRGYELLSRARQFVRSDFDEFDIILAMDHSNFENILSLDPNGTYKDKVKLMLDYSKGNRGESVPDPYYGGAAGFEHVIDLLEESCQNLFNELSK